MQQASASFPNKDPSPALRPEPWPLAPCLCAGPQQAFVNTLAAEYLMSSIWLNDRAIPVIYRSRPPAPITLSARLMDKCLLHSHLHEQAASTASIHDHTFPISWALNEPGSKEMINPYLLHSPQGSNWETEEKQSGMASGARRPGPAATVPITMLSRPGLAISASSTRLHLHWDEAVMDLCGLRVARSLWGGEAETYRLTTAWWSLRAHASRMLGVRSWFDGIVLSKQTGLIFRSPCCCKTCIFCALSFSLQGHCCCLPHGTPSPGSTRSCTGVFFSWSAKQGSEFRFDTLSCPGPCVRGS